MDRSFRNANQDVMSHQPCDSMALEARPAEQSQADESRAAGETLPSVRSVRYRYALIPRKPHTRRYKRRHRLHQSS